jgi:hypothetical protein
MGESVKASKAVLIALLALSSAVSAGTLKDGLLTVDGRPFYVLSGWDDRKSTTVDDIVRLGMNTSFRGAPSTDTSMKSFRAFMWEAAEKGIQVVPYLSYGGTRVTPWAPEKVKRVSTLSREPNLLAWYVGDDITMKHLDGIKQTVSILRKKTPHLAVVADYIADETPEARTTFTKYVDIRCQYTYPVTRSSFHAYAEFFDEQRVFVGDPLWTWVQAFMWRSDGLRFNLSFHDGGGPFPEPEQTRLMSFVAINRGIRGLQFFQHNVLLRQPELAAEVAYICHEVRLFNDQLAAGIPAFDLVCSDTAVKATAFTYKNTVAVSMALIKDTYHRWVDDATVRNVTITVPWTDKKLPQAVLVRLPDAFDCMVAKGKTAGTVDITVPELEVAGLMLVSADEEDFTRLREGVTSAVRKLAPVGIMGAVAQARKVGTAIWQVGFEGFHLKNEEYLHIIRANEVAVDACVSGRYDVAVRKWRESLRFSRVFLDSMMKVALKTTPILMPHERPFLQGPYTLFNIPEIMLAPDPAGKWHFVRDFMIVGPFKLDGNNDLVTIPGKFDHPYGPEKASNPSVVFETVDGEASWKPARATLSGDIDFLKFFRTTDDMLCYARCLVTSPVDTTMTLGLGSNDGAVIWVNREQVFRLHTGRRISPIQNTVKVKLRKGTNTVMVKVTNLGSNWQLYLSFDDQKRILKYSTN